MEMERWTLKNKVPPFFGGHFLSFSKKGVRNQDQEVNEMRGINIVLIIAVLAVVMIMPVMAFEPGECDIEVHPGDNLDAKVDSATDGQTVCVYAGTYGWFSINTPNITLKGEGADKVTLDCGGTRSAIGNVEPHCAPGCIVDGFKFVNSDEGIDVNSGAPNSIVRNCVFEGMTQALGVLLHGENTTFMNNVVSDTTGDYCALYIAGSHSTIDNNTFRDNIGAGISIGESTGFDIKVTKNNITSNAYAGIELYNAGSDNKIYLNNFVDNGVTATTTGTTAPAVTYWNSTEQIEYTYGGTTYTNYLGNYWDDYTGPDTSPEDGIGDVPYQVYGTDMDNRPLMAGFENCPAPAGGLCGDVNEDGSVDFIDVGLVGRHKLYGDALADTWAADVNGDDSIDFIDVGLIGRHKLYGDALCCK